MILAAQIASVISILACLVLATRGGLIRRLGFSGVLKYGAIWGAIIIAVMTIVSFLGVR
ncbi:hypothetical protein WSK_1136 [Novosphingobium sp. Rr 2-17]|nr:hypothetical protein WSK_1136 [Novosphingobium sp. Rr 2-17]